MRVRITSVTGETLEDDIDCAPARPPARPPAPLRRSAGPSRCLCRARVCPHAAASRSHSPQRARRSRASQRRAAAPAARPPDSPRARSGGRRARERAVRGHPGARVRQRLPLGARRARAQHAAVLQPGGRGAQHRAHPRCAPGGPGAPGGGAHCVQECPEPVPVTARSRAGLQTCIRCATPCSLAVAARCSTHAPGASAPACAVCAAIAAVRA